MNKAHPARAAPGMPARAPPLKLLFLPNLFLSKHPKQCISFADGLHIFDERILHPRNIIEKRHKIYKALAAGLSYTFFGDLSWEESPEDAWLLVGLRESTGDRFRKLNCGQNFHRYQLMKTQNKFFQAVKAGAEKYSLTSRYASHFSEL